MPTQTVADKLTIDYFLNKYPDFKKKAKEMIEKNPNHRWLWTSSLFSDPQDFNELHLLVYDSQHKEVGKISQYEAGY